MRNPYGCVVTILMPIGLPGRWVLYEVEHELDIKRQR
jgi:hypothetical protein